MIVAYVIERPDRLPHARIECGLLTGAFQNLLVDGLGTSGSVRFSTFSTERAAYEWLQENADLPTNAVWVLAHWRVAAVPPG